MKRLILALGLFMALLNGCHLLTPADPPFEPKTLRPDDVAWDKLDIARALEFTGYARIDCAKIQSVLSASGKCLPVKMPIGNGIQCPLDYPASDLIFACLPADDAPSVYLQFNWIKNAKNIDLTEYFGPCHIESEGMKSSEKRYDTDYGYRACFFDNPSFKKMPDKRYAPEDAQGFVSELRKDPVYLRPAGLYVDLHDQPFPDTPETPEEANTADPTENPGEDAQIIAPKKPDFFTLMLDNMAKTGVFEAPASLVLDARLLNEEEKVQALKNAFVIFNYYREFDEHSSLVPSPK